MALPVIYKFGGASVKDAEAFRQLKDILRNTDDNVKVVVLSAMGKTTNSLEEVVNASFQHKAAAQLINSIRSYHFGVMENLFPTAHPVFHEIEEYFEALVEAASKSEELAYDQLYDKLICFGELISSKILSAYLEQEGVHNSWHDIRKYLICDHPFRAGRVNWHESQKRIQKMVENQDGIIITQGFIGGTFEGDSISLGREGSDFTAAIIAYSIDAGSVHIWKDVPGLMNADPAIDKDAEKFDRMPYDEAIVLSFYGAKVIHPKTIKPLENKKIPLWVRPFNSPEEKGTLISNFASAQPQLCSVIRKHDQLLFTLKARDMSFISEQHIHEIMGILCTMDIRINLMQSSALHFSFCTDMGMLNVRQLTERLSEHYIVKYNKGMSLLTLRHYQQNDINRNLAGSKVIMEQRTRVTYQALVEQV